MNCTLYSMNQCKYHIDMQNFYALHNRLFGNSCFVVFENVKYKTDKKITFNKENLHFDQSSN